MADPRRIRTSAVVKGTPGILSWALILMLLSNLWWLVLGLGSMSSIAISYGESGAVFCGLRGDGSHHASCYGSNPAIVYRTPRFPFIGLTAGDGFMCGLLMESGRPYCWGSSGYVQMGVPQPMPEGSRYLEISAGDHHLCGLRHSDEKTGPPSSLVDCWGYNMTTTHAFDGRLQSISAGSEFNCGLFSENRTVVCWGDQTSSRVISLIPRGRRFRRISAGGYHVCGIPEGVSSGPFCWGRSLDIEELSEGDANQGGVDSPPSFPMTSIAGAKFHACGIRSSDRRVACWGFRVKNSTPMPEGVRVYELAAGDYFTCGIVGEKSLQPVCWGLGFPSTLPLAASPGACRRIPCPPGSYESNNGSSACKSPESRICLPCSDACPPGTRQKVSCTAKSDRICEFNCSGCSSADCFWNCSSTTGKRRNWSVQLVVIAAEIVFVVFMVGVVSLTAVFYVRYRLRNCRCSQNRKAYRCVSSSSRKEDGKVQPDGDEEHKVRRARKFTYGELERATGGFSEESQVGKGSFSRVFKGVLEDGAVVAVKRAVVSSDLKKNSREFRTELDLLSRLNHAHLLNLLGYCEEGRERLLVYEFMAHGSLHQHLHGKKSTALRERLDWVRRVTIAVQAARGIEYLHGYACPPVIHRDIKSSNILIDEEHNARVADFGLSLLGPADSASPLAELPAGTLGYLDPEYYRLHYLTTKSDVYSFGVLLLEILSGRKAIDMRFEEGNIVEWAVPLVRSGDVSAVLDPELAPPPDMEAVRRIANVACKCVRMRGRERPSMDRVTTGLERALAALMGSPCSDQPILPTEVVLGSSRMHKKPSRRTSDRSPSEEDAAEDQRFEFRAPSWITFPSVASSSHRRKSSASEADIAEGRGGEGRGGGDVGRGLEEEIEPASPRESMFLQHNF